MRVAFLNMSLLFSIMFLSSSMLLQVAVVHSFSLLYNNIVCKICHILVINFPANGHLPDFQLFFYVKWCCYECPCVCLLVYNLGRL